MASRLVDGVRIPEFVSAHPALELCNTRAGWGTPFPKDYLADFATLAVWARENQLVTGAEFHVLLREAEARPAAARSVLARARALRDSLYSTLTQPDDATAADRLRAFVTAAATRSVYRADADGRLLLDGGTGLQSPVDRAALAAHRLLESYGRDAVGRCPGEGCGWLFFDPAGRRRWCIMAVCGNRAKARRFAERQRA